MLNLQFDIKFSNSLRCNIFIDYIHWYGLVVGGLEKVYKNITSFITAYESFMNDYNLFSTTYPRWSRSIDSRNQLQIQEHIF